MVLKLLKQDPRTLKSVRLSAQKRYTGRLVDFYKRSPTSGEHQRLAEANGGAQGVEIVCIGALTRVYGIYTYMHKFILIIYTSKK